jgi:HEPN domain-containing protein
MPADEIVSLLLRKADQDVYVLEKLLADAAAPIEVFGFHAQQATEKLIKAMLAFHKIAYGRTHRLGELVDLAADNGVAFPESVELLVDLTPYAVEFRYDVAPEDGADDLDKQKVLDKIRVLRKWVTEHSKTSAAGDAAPPTAK